MRTNETFTIEHRGCRLAYNVRGDGPPVLLIQGVGLHGDGWRPQVDELAARYRCLTFDNRGMNRSQPIGVPLSVEQLAEGLPYVIAAKIACLAATHSYRGIWRYAGVSDVLR